MGTSSISTVFTSQDTNVPTLSPGDSSDKSREIDLDLLKEAATSVVKSLGGVDEGIDIRLFAEGGYNRAWVVSYRKVRPICSSLPFYIMPATCMLEYFFLIRYC